ncbi:hypothetical protein IP88_12495 [alpha proteobacterium AAP81b]|nr:hypothetical protein IP88_12495 [alpha proteobacterium AAP81b]
MGRAPAALGGGGFVMILLALLIGIIAGLRTMMAPTAIAWAAATGGLDLAGSWLAFLGARYTPWIFTALALGELVTDKLPVTPSRKTPPQFIARLISGGLGGAAIGIGVGSLWFGLALGVVGAVIGTFGGAAARGWLAARLGSDRPAALIEDAVAIGGAMLVFAALGSV